MPATPTATATCSRVATPTATATCSRAVVLGTHGADRPVSTGQRASRGCVRVSDDAGDQPDRILPLGTPVVAS